MVMSGVGKRDSVEWQGAMGMQIWAGDCLTHTGTLIHKDLTIPPEG